MLNFIGIVSLIILIIAIYQYRNLVIPEDNIEGFSNYWLRYRGIPDNWKRDTAYIRVFADDYLHIYHNVGSQESGITGKSPWRNTKWVGQARCCGRCYLFEVPNFKGGDSLMFYSYNGGGPGYWGGFMFLNGKWTSFNKSSVKISAYQLYSDIYKKSGKYLGCYRDGGNRRVPYYSNWRGTFENCQDSAHRRNHRYFATQHGGWCATGTDWNRAQSYGKLPDRYCANQDTRIRNGNGTIRWTQRYGLGGPWANAIYDSKRPAEIDYYGNWSRRWLRNANRRGWTLMLYQGIYGLKPRNAGHSRQHSLWRWVQFQYKNPKPPVKLEFCPDKRYTEFNSAGCSNPDSTYTCKSSVYPNYKATMSACHNTFKVDGNNYDNEDFYKIVGTAVTMAKENKWSNKYNSLKTAFLHASNIACSILGHKNISSGIGYNKSECKSKSGNYDVTYLNEIISTARKESDKHSMNNGKTANKFLRKELDNAVIDLLNEARELIGHNSDECKCKDFSSGSPTCKPC